MPLVVRTGRDRRLSLRPAKGGNLRAARQKALTVEPPEAPDVTAMRALRSKTAFHVEIMPLAEFAKFLSKKYSLSFKLDPDGLKRARVDPARRSRPTSTAFP